MPKNRDQFWPKKLKWVWMEPVDDEPGFYDAEFGSLHLTVVKRKDGRYGVAVDADDGATRPMKGSYDKLSDAKRGACAWAAVVLREGMNVLEVAHRRL